MSESKRKFMPLMNTSLVQRLTDKGLLPTGTTRFLIDSGKPGNAVRIYWAGFANADLIDELLDGLEEIGGVELNASTFSEEDEERICAIPSLTFHEVWLLKQWYAAAAAESSREWDAEAQALFAKMGVNEEPVI